ncbi:hypothetical protein [Pedobacter sp. MW01-1-1]|uniref:hypothetical protein n=1 Tax=Pedobacter sp. MW01-1-1 TaxID=3383027 RepID=UPI003FF0B55E
MSRSNSPVNQFTKEGIKTRMINNAVNLWGVKNATALDPFVKLLIEAFSVEIHRCGNEAQSIESRLLDKIARLLTPDLLSMPKAAHSIMTAIPSSGSLLLHPQTHFYSQKRVVEPNGVMASNQTNIMFTPVDYVKLVNGRVRYVVGGRQFFEVNEHHAKTPLLHTANPLEWGTAYIGLELDESVHDLEGLSLYFDFPAYQTESWVYQLLPLCKSALNGKEVLFTPGQEYPSPHNLSKEQMIFRDYDLMYQVTREVKSQYQHKFLTFGPSEITHNIAEAEDKYPTELIEIYGMDMLRNKVKKNVVWLRLQFSANYTYDILENMVVCLNAFPVINRSIKTNSYYFGSLNGILPLRTDLHEYFMAVCLVIDSKDRVFSDIPFKRASGLGQGYYSMRHGGAERFDKRNALEMVRYLIELTRDEVAAFSSFNNDFIVNALAELSTQLRMLNSKTDQLGINVKEVPTYLIAEPYEDTEELKVDYWVTQCELADNIRAFTNMALQSDVDLNRSTIFLLLDTEGGREKLQSGAQLDAYRFALVSRGGRLITTEDIRNFCKYELGDKLKTVQVEKGIVSSPHPKEGYVRTLDIKLNPNQQAKFNQEEWGFIAQTLESKIRANSPEGIQYRVLVNEN